MNQAERRLAEPTRHKRRRPVRELEADLRKRANEWNNDPKPFIWTRTADEIFDTPAAYCERIKDSGH